MATRYDVIQWRNVPESTINALREFLEWVEDHCLEEEHKQVTMWIDRYLQTDDSQIKAAEKIMLDDWIQSSKRA